MAFMFIVFGAFSYLSAEAYADPLLSPPEGNVRGPLNMSVQSQTKSGDISVDGFKAAGINLGGVLRNSWSQIGGACAWQGTRCHCASDDSSIGSVRLTIGITCNGGTVTNLKVVNIDISSREKRCWSSAPSGCDRNLYTTTGLIGSSSSSGVSGAATAVVSVVVRTVRSISRFFGSLF